MNSSQPKKVSYFTFGQSHRHNIDGVIYDKDVIVRIEADCPRDVMFQKFGQKWSMEYAHPPNSKHFPRGIINVRG